GSDAVRRRRRRGSANRCRGSRGVSRTDGQHAMKRLIIIALVVVIALGVAAPYLEADRFRPGIERALERSLGRKVEVGAVHFKVLTGPGFTLDNVVIHEDARAGIEPFAY